MVTTTQTSHDTNRTRIHRQPGFLLFNRPPRLWEAVDKTTITLPQPPVPATTSRSAMVSALGLPLLSFIVMLAIAMYMSGSQSTAGAFILPMVAMSSVYLIGAVWSVADEFFTNRKQFKQQTAEYKELLISTEQTLVRLNSMEAQIRGDIDPAVSQLLDRASNSLRPSPRLWERRRTDGDFLRVRFGVGSIRSSTEVTYTAPPRPTDLSKEAEVLVARYANVSPAPVTVSFKEAGSLGVAGPVGPTNSLVISLMCQIVANHSPNDVRVMAIFPHEHLQVWDWLRWTPHSESVRGGDIGERALGCTPERAQGIMRSLQDELSARERRLSAQNNNDPASIPGPHIVVLLDGDDLLGDGIATEFLLSRGPSLNVHTIFISRAISSLPSSCGAVINVGNTPDELVSYRVVSTRQREYAMMDATSPDTAERLARALAPLRLAATDRTNGIPDQVNLLDLVGIEDPATADIWSRWSKHDPQQHLRIPVGQTTGESTLYLSLQSGSAEGGPHGVVGGMTGSGKSELLRSVVAAFAVTHHPHRLNFVLIDYKGGSAFQGLEELPHVVGFVTNLDEHLAERALVALQSELKERQRRLAAAGVESVAAYQELFERDASRQMEPLPNLVILIDEFAQLKEEVPDFIQGLIGIARVGRSLGVHLLLATQKPSGVVTDEIRANTSYKVCLRVAETQDSTEVIGVPDAALLPRTVPGRAFVQVGSESVMAFQAARITMRYTQPMMQSEFSIEDFTPADKPGLANKAAPQAMVVNAQSETELQVLVRRIAEEAAAHNIKPLRPPWPPPLPNGVALRDVLPAHCFPTQGIPYRWPDRPPDGWAAAPVGLIDDPGRQRQDPFVLRLSEAGHVLVFGMARTGKSTFLRTAAAALALTHSPTDLQIYCLEFGRGALAPLGRLPHCGDILYPGDVEKIRRFLSDLRADMAARAQEIQRAGVFTLSEYLVSSQKSRHFPYKVVLLDNFITFRETFFGDNAVLEMNMADEMLGDLTSLLREGQPVGIHFLITSDTWSPVARYPAIINSVGLRVALRQADTSDYSYIGLRKRDELALTSGRGFASGATPLECQIAMPATVETNHEGVDLASRRADYVSWLRSKLLGETAGPKPSFDQTEVPVEWMTGEEQTDTLEQLCDRLCAAWTGEKAPQIPLLPDLVTLEDILPLVSKDGAIRTPIGIDDADLQPFTLDMRPENPVFLVTGPAQSGKSTLLVSTALGIAARYSAQQVRMGLVSYRRSPLRRMEKLPHVAFPSAKNSNELNDLLEKLEVEIDERQRTATETGSPVPILLFIDDLEEVLLDEMAPLSRLTDVAKRGRTLGLTLLVAGLNQEIARAYDSFTDYLRRDQTGVLLSPNLRDDGEIMSMRLPMMQHRSFPPGRGFYVRRRAWKILQITNPAPNGQDIEEAIEQWLKNLT